MCLIFSLFILKVNSPNERKVYKRKSYMNIVMILLHVSMKFVWGIIRYNEQPFRAITLTYNFKFLIIQEL